VKAQDLRLEDLLESDSRGGTMRFAGNRVLLFDAVALGLLRAQLVENFGVDATRALITQFGFSHGWCTAESLEHALAWDTPREWRIAGGRVHRLQGLVRFEPVPRERSGVVAEAIWNESYEAEQHILHLGLSDQPVCWSLAGYASGYLSRATGKNVYAVEESCRGKGDATCQMVAKTREDWGDEIEPLLRYYEKDCLEPSLRGLRDSVKQLEARLASQKHAIGADQRFVDNGGIVARSKVMVDVMDLARRVAAVDSSVLITGESGVGKERIAQFIHDTSPRAAGPFVAVNCGALPEQLLESELFGHVRGAFTGASSDRPGLFEAATGGTLLLDEIGDMPLPLQVRLLRVLQEREVRRLGENRTRRVDVRILAATHRDLRRAVERGEFREDLLFRINVLQIAIPALRQRPDDIVPLARLKLHDFAQRFGKDAEGFTPAAQRYMMEQPWRGNVRELHNAVERAVALSDRGPIDVGDLQLPGKSAPTGGGAAAANVEASLEEVERQHILAVLEHVGGNRADAARSLGIGTATLYRKLKKYKS